MPTYQAAVFSAPNAPIQLREFADPELEPGAALLETMYSEVCGTDVHLHHGKLSGVPYPIIPGHVSVGRVAKVRGPIRTVEGDAIKEGDVVTFLDVHETCNNCYHCLVADQPNRCPSRKVYGITYSANDGLLGGWSQAIYMKPGVKMIRLPQGLDPETFIGGGCGLVTALHAVDLARLRLGESVLIMGAGPVGQSAIALASLSGAGEVVALDGVADRLEFARRMGAMQTISLDLPRKERLSRAHALTRARGFDVAIEASGAPEAVSEALDLVRDGGRVVVCGHYTDNGPVEIHPHWQINRKHVEVRGCWGSKYQHFHRAVQIAGRFGGTTPWNKLATRKYRLSDAADALSAIGARKQLKAILTACLALMLAGSGIASAQTPAGDTIRKVDTTSVQTLPTVKVAGRMVSVPGRYAAAYKRAAAGRGFYVTREEIAATNPQDLESILSRVPTVQVNDRGVSFSRCQGGLPSPGQPLPAARIQVFIDGRRASLTDNDGVRQLIGSIPVSTIQLLEVYTGVSRIPAEFVDDACAVIVIWTKSY